MGKLTPGELVALLKSLRGIGVTRAKLGTMEFDIAPIVRLVPVSSEPKGDDDDADVLFHSTDAPDELPVHAEDDE